VHGRLVLVTSAVTTPADRLLLGHAVSLIALDGEQPRRARESLNRLGTTLCDLLLDGTVDQSIPDELAVVAVLDAEHKRVFAAADRVLASRGQPVLATVRDEHSVILVPSDVDIMVGGHAGRSMPCGPEGLPAALRQAVIAARVARSRDVPLVRFESLAGQVLSATPETRAMLADLAVTRLRPLDGTGLVETLRSFLEHNGHAEATSTALGVHRHTLRARLDRIRDLMDVDLDDAYVRAELLLALNAV